MESKPQVTILETQKTKSSLKKDKTTLEDGKGLEYLLKRTNVRVVSTILAELNSCHL